MAAILQEEKSEPVLVVDDDMEICETIAFYLSEAGYEAVVATTREKALDRLRKGIFSAMLTDHSMPGMDINEFMDRVREIRPSIPVALVTGSLQPAKLAKEAGIEHFLQKPFIYEDLLKLVVDLTRKEHQV